MKWEEIWCEKNIWHEHAGGAEIHWNNPECVSLVDGFPQCVCSECLDKLTDFKVFKDKCLKSRSTFQQMLQRKIEQAKQKDLQDVQVDVLPMVCSIKEEPQESEIVEIPVEPEVSINEEPNEVTIKTEVIDDDEPMEEPCQEGVPEAIVLKTEPSEEEAEAIEEESEVIIPDSLPSQEELNSDVQSGDPERLDSEIDDDPIMFVAVKQDAEDSPTNEHPD